MSSCSATSWHRGFQMLSWNSVIQLCVARMTLLICVLRLRIDVGLFTFAGGIRLSVSVSMIPFAR